MKNIKMMKNGNSLLPNCLGGGGHNLLLISRIKNKSIREIYVKGILQNGWGRDMLVFQISNNYHLRIGSSSNNFNDKIIDSGTDLVNNTFKDTYIFDFIK